MALTALGGAPLVIVGGTSRQGSVAITAGANTTLDAALESVCFFGRVWTEDGASHTIDTTGSSALGWRTGTITFANGGTTVTVGLAGVDMTAGPPARAVNVADAITFDVGVTFTGGGGGITSNVWNESVPTAGTKTIANGDLVAFCVQMVTRGGAADTILPQAMATITPSNSPNKTNFVGGSYASAARLPNCVITFNDGALGFFHGGVVNTTVTTVTWNSGDATKEYGNYFALPVPATIYGIVAQVDPDADFDVVLYSDPLGTPVPEKTVSFDANAMTGAAIGLVTALFPTPYSATASQPLVGALKPGGSNISSNHIVLNEADYQKSMSLGANCYAVNRAAAAFSAQNSNKDRFAVGLLVGAFDDGTGGGGAGGGSVFGSKGGVIT